MGALADVLAHAEYLSTDFHRHVHAAFREWTQEEADPDLKVERAVDGDRRKGWDNDRIAARIDGIVQRKILTDVLQSRGVVGVGYARCSDAINVEVLGKTAKEFKLAKGLPAKANTVENSWSFDAHSPEAARMKRWRHGSKMGAITPLPPPARSANRAGQAVREAMRAMGIAS